MPTILEDALIIPSSSDIAGMPEFQKSRAEWGGGDAIESQDHMNNFVSENVAKNLYAVGNSADIRSFLPFRTGLVIEANATRSISGTGEKSRDVTPPSINLLDYLVVDPDFSGFDALGLTALKFPKLPFHNGTLKKFVPGAVAISIRPLYVNPFPKATNPISPVDLSTQDVHNFHKGENIRLPSGYSLPFQGCRGEYTSARSFAIIHNAPDWEVNEFLTSEECQSILADEGLESQRNARNFRQVDLGLQVSRAALNASTRPPPGDRRQLGKPLG